MIDNEANPRGINTSSVCGASNTATARSILKVTATTRSEREYMKAMPQLKALAQKYGCEIEKYEIRFEYESGAPDSTPVYLVYVNGKFSDTLMSSEMKPPQNCASALPGSRSPDGTSMKTTFYKSDSK